MMYNKQLSPPTGGDPLRQNQHQHYVEEHTSDSAAEEAIAWSSLCDQFTRNLLKLELQTTETQYRSELIEEESALRVFIYNSLLFGITSHSARLSGQFSDLMENVRTLQNSHDKLLNEKQTHAHAIAEYHAQQILEQRSQAEAQAVNYQTRIENLREDERDLRVRVENLRREAEESQTNLEKRRNDSLEERRVLENDLQRLQNEVGNQKYLLDRLNAQVDSAKQKLRETERLNIERSVSGGYHHSSASRNPSPADTQQSYQHHQQQRAGNYDNYPNNTQSATTPRPAASSTPLSALPHHSSAASPDRHGDSISTGLSNIQTVRDSGVDEQFLRTGRVTPVRIPPQFYASSQQQQQNNNNTRTPIFNSNPTSGKHDQNTSSSSTKTPLAGLSATAQRSVSDVYQSQQHQIYSPAAMNASRNPMIVNGGLFDQQQQQKQQTSASATRGIGSSIISQQQQQQPSQWQLRLMKLQGELKSLKNDLGVASPPQK